MLVTDDRLVGGRDLVQLALSAQRGGVTSVQLRLKRATARELALAARALVEALHIPVLVNDRPDVALAAGAAGVHLGADDLPVGPDPAPRAGRLHHRRVGGKRERSPLRRRSRLLGNRALALYLNQG